MAELMQPNIVGNFLSAYSSGLERQQQQQDAAYQRQRQARADEMAEQKFNFDMDASQLDMALKRASALNEILSGVDERNPQTLEVAKQRYITTFGGKPEEVAGVTIADIPRIKMQTGALEKQLRTQLVQAQIGTEQAQGRAADALARARRMAAAGGGVGGPYTASGDPAAPGSGTANLKLTEGQSKDVMFYGRAREANTGFTDDRVNALISTKQAGARAIPIVGRALQSDASRQGTQVAKNFIAAVLRKDTGAAVTDTEFDFYGDIFIPSWGDDAGTLELKKKARESFLENMRKGMSNLAALEAAGIVNIPENLRPLGDAPETTTAAPPAASRGASAATGNPPPAAGAASPKTFRYDANGNRVQ